MGFLLDTNVVSEAVKPRPAASVLAWLGDQVPGDLFLASMSLGDMVRGARRVQDAAKRDRLERWIEADLTTQFEGRILPFDQAAAVIWGKIMGDADRVGHTRPAADAQIAAVARRHDLTLVTRHSKDFTGMDVVLLDLL